MAFGSFVLPPPAATHQRLDGVAAGGGDGRGRVPRGRRGAPASFVGLFLAGRVCDATVHVAVGVGDLRFCCLCGGVGGDARRRRSSPPAAPPQHEVGAAAGLRRAATHPHLDATSSVGEPPVRLLAFCGCLPPPPPTDDPATWLQVAVTVAGGWRGVAVVLLHFFFASLWLEGGGHATGDGVVGVGYLSFLVHLWGGRRRRAVPQLLLPPARRPPPAPPLRSGPPVPPQAQLSAPNPPPPHLRRRLPPRPRTVCRSAIVNSSRLCGRRRRRRALLRPRCSLHGYPVASATPVVPSSPPRPLGRLRPLAGAVFGGRGGP